MWGFYDDPEREAQQMSKQCIKQLIESRMQHDGLIETGIEGVQLFRVTEPIQCAPATYEPSVSAIVSGSKEAIWHGQKQVFDSQRYLCCTMPMPVEAGTPLSSPDNPLLGVYLSLDTKVMTELAIEMESAPSAIAKTKGSRSTTGIAVSCWDAHFTDALWRLLALGDDPRDVAVLGKGRLRELYYAVLKGDAGSAVRQAFGLENEIARAIAYLSSRLSETVTIEELAERVGMSRAVFHRKFKQATNMSPIQFVKSMRLNSAAMQIARGSHVNVAAMAVGYVSSSQFSREFKRMYGQSPKQWSHANTVS